MKAGDNITQPGQRPKTETQHAKRQAANSKVGAATQLKIAADEAGNGMEKRNPFAHDVMLNTSIYVWLRRTTRLGQAGPTMFDCNRDALPALAGACGSSWACLKSRLVIERGSNRTPLPFIPLPAHSSTGEGYFLLCDLTQGVGSQTRLYPWAGITSPLRGFSLARCARR